VVDKDGKREAKVIASAWTGPMGSSSTTARSPIAEAPISKLEKIEDISTSAESPSSFYSDFPNHQSTVGNFMGLGPDNKLYVTVGAPCNHLHPPQRPTGKSGHQSRRQRRRSGRPRRAQLGRLRWHPVSKELYFTMTNGRDWLSEDLPNDSLNRVTRRASTSAIPIATRAIWPTRNSAGADRAASSSAPVALWGRTPRRSACASYTGSMFPAGIHRTRSSSRATLVEQSKKLGGDIVVAKLNKGRHVKPGSRSSRVSCRTTTTSAVRSTRL